MTAEEFIREKIREKQELRGEMQALWKYSVSGEDCLRWAHEYAELAALSPAIPESLEERQALKKAWSESSALPLVSPDKQEWVSVETLREMECKPVTEGADLSEFQKGFNWAIESVIRKLSALPYTEEK